MSKAREILNTIKKTNVSEEDLILSSGSSSEQSDPFDIMEMVTEDGHDYYVGSWSQNEIRMNLIAEPRIDEGGPNLFIEIEQDPKVRYAYTGADFKHRSEIYPEFKKIARHIKASGLKGANLSADWKAAE